MKSQRPSKQALAKYYQPNWTILALTLMFPLVLLGVMFIAYWFRPPY